MSDIVLDCNKKSDNVVIVYKSPEYLINARRKYYESRKLDPEYKQRKLENIKAWREKNRAHVNEVERLRKQKKREEQKAKKMVSVIEPVVEPVIEAVKDVKPTETPLDSEQTIVTGMDKIALDIGDKIGVPDQVIKNDDETKTAEKPKAKRGRKRVVVM